MRGLGFRVERLSRRSPWIGGGFYMYTVIKDGPDIDTTKKFGDTFISSRFSVLTCVPFWTERVLMKGNGAAKKTIIPLDVKNR